MTNEIKEILIYGHASGPNPWKVIMVLEELELPYKHKLLEMSEIKQEPYIHLNPNGRVPTIEDPNTGITLWESGAIIEYLIDTYDKERKLSIDTFPEKYHLKQFLYFQSSGQGPYYGQLAWFKAFHPEKIESAIARYEDQAIRVVAVLDKILQGKEYLVGNRITYADIAFVSWEVTIRKMIPDLDERAERLYPNYLAWFRRVSARPSVKRTLKLKSEAMA
ncbi:URE2 protein [Ophiobolus disseminans]|uniref:glutathione transferase n=1 Tax=Ophiobolus disseminans TaxID=1469910 RepID=A0A6A7AIA4_9PLEO|nr:URE2 protein [Ophiobolus disseminans]